MCALHVLRPRREAPWPCYIGGRCMDVSFLRPGRRHLARQLLSRLGPHSGRRKPDRSHVCVLHLDRHVGRFRLQQIKSMLCTPLVHGLPRK